MPYAPGVQDISGQLLAQGIMQAGNALSGALSQRMEEEKLRARRSKALDTILETSGLATRDQIMPLSLDQKEGLYHGAIFKDQLQKAAADIQAQQGQIKLNDLQLEGLRAQAANAAKRPDFQRALGSGENAPTHSDIMRAAGDTGYILSDEQLANIMKPEPLALGAVVNVPGGGRLIGTGGQPHVMTDPLDPAKGQALTLDGKPIGKALFGDKVVDLPDAKTLTQQEIGQVQALNQAGLDLDRIDKIFAAIDKSATGPVVGRLRALNPYDTNRQLLEQAINAAVPNLARGVFREVGVLTDADVARYAKQFPTLIDPPGIREKKLHQLRLRLKEGQEETVKQLKKAGRDVSGFGDAATAAPAATVPKPGKLYTDGSGATWKYNAKNPSNPTDPANWDPVK